MSAFGAKRKPSLRHRIASVCEMRCSFHGKAQLVSFVSAARRARPSRLLSPTGKTGSAAKPRMVRHTEQRHFQKIFSSERPYGKPIKDCLNPLQNDCLLQRNQPSRVL
jgi:hypothetical protein